MNNQYLLQAIQIGDNILAKSIKEEKGLSWETLSLGKDNTIKLNKSVELYSGVSGICLFLIELYKTTEDKKYLNAAIQGMQWVEWYIEENKSNNYAFLTGRMGIPYVFLQLAEVTKEKKYITKALNIAKQADVFIQNGTTICEYINGAAGTLWALMYIHSKTNDTDVLKLIHLYTDYLTSRIHISSKGYYWDRSYSMIKPLCGFSHGVSGIGYVFLELGSYFDNPTWYTVAEQAFKYENSWYDASIKNWPDLRLQMYSPEQIEEHKQYYKEGKREKFTESNDMNAWCHGAAGIGLSRVRAHKILERPLYKRDYIRALRKTILTDINTKTDKSSFTLCHGLGGNAELFIKVYEHTGNTAFLSHAEHIANRILEHKKLEKPFISGLGRYSKNTEDLSLFMGNAGIGYYLLRTFNTNKTPSILAPAISVKSPVTFKDFIEKKPLNRLEKEKIKLEEKIKSYGLMFIEQNILKAEQGREVSKEALLPQRLKLSTYVSLFKNKNTYYLLYINPKKLYSQEVNYFCYSVLISFTIPTTISKALQQCKNKFPKQDITKLFIQQINVALQSQILLK